MTELRSPTDQQRTLVLGRTGSGKSQFSIYLLASRNFHEMPWVIIDYKGEDLIADIRAVCPAIKEIKVTDKPPTKSGLYWMRPTPKVDDAAMEAWLWKVWKQTHVGLFIDEGFALPQKDAFDAILTQGRSLHIPVICLYQRPAWMSRFAVAQADFFAVFDQNDERDLKTTKAFIKPATNGSGQEVTVYAELPSYYCLWYDVGKGKTNVLKPAPSREEIIATFKRRLNKKAVNRQKAFV